MYLAGEYNRHQEECYTSDSTGLALPQPGEWVVLIATTVISDNCIYAQIPLGGGYSLLKGGKSHFLCLLCNVAWL